MFPPRYCRCAVKRLKTLTLFKDEAKETDTLFKARTKKNDIQFKEKTKTMNGTNRSTVFHFCDTGSLKASSVELIFCLDGHLRIAMLADTIQVGNLSKDHTVNAINVNRGKNDTLF